MYHNETSVGTIQYLLQYTTLVHCCRLGSTKAKQSLLPAQSNRWPLISQGITVCNTRRIAPSDAQSSFPKVTGPESTEEWVSLCSTVNVTENKRGAGGNSLDSPYDTFQDILNDWIKEALVYQFTFSLVTSTTLSETQGRCHQDNPDLGCVG